MVAKKPTKKPSVPSPFLTSSWFDIDKSINNLKKEMEKAFSSFPTTMMPRISQTSCDIIDEGKQFRVKMDVPGIKKNEIKLNVTENSLEISGEHKEESEEKKKNFLTKERSQVSYYRTLPLSENIVASKVKAKLSDGVLDITLPKSKPTKTQKKKSVSIQ
ncbi:heat shock protein Hsp20 [Candidatus Nitrosopumilus koreensis AR1]|uniref:Heat shock protein Hsp20 n=1 Tax=Candidatus Nitrosopumilus koreensis AR1 TaxID=1229908 RepID=K0B9X4_9ARCH|nr:MULTISPECIES: Hsp20/alpha crystallin family protein [Nitrosopumilus]AFS81780.1 heat shock protein Hsp20 [Candidatus Nitrosopumilus koreensis AR1]